MAAAAAVVQTQVRMEYPGLGGELPSGALFLNMTALEESFGEALRLLAERWRQTVFTERERCQAVLRQKWFQFKEELQDNGSAFAAIVARQGLGGLAGVAAEWDGLAYGRRLKRLARCFGTEYEGFADSMGRMAALCGNLRPVGASVVGNDALLPLVKEFMEKNFPGGEKDCAMDVPMKADSSAPRLDALRINGDVGFCARVFQAPAYDDESNAALSVYCWLVSCGFLWDEVRVKGGAYGVGCSYNPALGLMTLSSFRDPSLKNTLQVFDRLAERTFDWTRKEVDSAIVACMKAEEQQVWPGMACRLALWRSLFGWDDERRRAYRQAFLSVTPEHVQVAGRRFWAAAAGKGNTCLVAPGSLCRGLHPNWLKL